MRSDKPIGLAAIILLNVRKKAVLSKKIIIFDWYVRVRTL